MSARGFASDNSATVHPDVLAAIARVNVGHAFGYGHDDYTPRVAGAVREHFGDQARAFLVFNGSAANVLSLRAACRPWQAAICTETAHMNVDECGAPEAVAGFKLLTVAASTASSRRISSRSRIVRVGDEHAVQPRVVSLTQCTELGTIYTPRETRKIADLAHENGMLVHMDGARLSNAAAALELPLRALTVDVGVDVLSFGGTKNGLLGGEAVVFLNPQLADGFEFLRKQTLQLASKMRFLAAQFDALLTDDLWLRCARQANAMASRLAQAVGCHPGGRDHASGPDQRRVRADSIGRPPPRCRSSSPSTSGTSTPARCGGCAHGTRLPRMSRRSPMPYGRHCA